MLGALDDEDGKIPGVITSPLPHGTNVAIATWGLNSNGNTNIDGASGVWVTPTNSAVASLYEVKVDPTSGAFDPSSSPTGTWLALSTSRAWTLTSAVADSVVFTVSFREKATGTVRDTQTNRTLSVTT